MATGIYRGRENSNRLFIALFILWPFFFSCTAQPSPRSILEPAQGSPVAITCSPGNIVAGDVNNDSKPDRVAACSQNRTLTLFKGRGNGQFDVTGNPLSVPYP